MRTERHNQPLPSEKNEERCQNEFGSTYQERTGKGYSCPGLLLVENKSFKSECLHQMCCNRDTKRIFMDMIMKLIGKEQLHLRGNAQEEIITRQNRKKKKQYCNKIK